MNPSAHRRIVLCCRLGMFIQAMVINLAPILFVPLKDELGLTYEQVGRLVLINFLTQMAVDLVCCGLADRMNPKPLIVAANALSAVGLWLFASPVADPAAAYHRLLLGTVVFSIGCGLLEVLLSPIIQAVPTEGRKEAEMAFLHAFYPLGKIAVIVATASALHVFGTERWREVMVAWSALPVLNTLGFATVRLPRFAETATRLTLRALLRKPAFALLLAMMALAGATELALGQWTSAFVEKGLGCSKLTADLLGFCSFGVGMAAGRLWYGFHGHRVEPHAMMRAGAWGSAVLLFAFASSPWPWLTLLACLPAGVAVSMLWPGTVSLAAGRFPLAGASMFAMLAAAGDTGGALMPWAVGAIADLVAAAPGAVERAAAWGVQAESLGLRAGLLFAVSAPLLLAAALQRARRGGGEAQRQGTR